MFLLFMLIFTLGVFLYFKRQKTLKRFEFLNGPEGFPLIGNAIEMMDQDNGLENSVRDFNLFGKTFKFFVGLIPSIITSDPKLIEIIVNSSTASEKSVVYTFLKRWWGDGLLTSTGKKWKSHRKILTPAFHYNILEDFVEVFESRGKLLIKNLENKADGNSFNIFAIFTLYTLDVICETAMGITVEAQTNPQHEYIKAVKDMCDIGTNRIINPFYRINKIYEMCPIFKEELKSVKIITDFSKGIIQKRKRVIENLSDDFVELDEFGKKKKTSFLDILLKSTIDGKPLPDEDIREEVDTFLFEGHDTTAIILSFIAYNLSKYPEIQRKVQEEIDGIFEDNKKRKTTIEDLQNMKYLEKVIKESLRLYPSVPVFGRTITEDVKYNGNIIPKGTSLLISTYGLHRDASIFPNPYKFDPERFTLENQASRGPYDYIPFSAGSRNCIGQKFAMLEIKSAISKIIRNFEIIRAPDYEPVILALLTLQAKNGVNVILKRRYD